MGTGENTASEEKENLPVLNPEQLLDISDHDLELILELIDEFLKDAPVYIQDLREAAASGDQEKITKKIHRLNGLIGNCGGERFLEAGREIEKKAGSGIFDEKEKWLCLLELELENLTDALKHADWKSLCE